MTEQEIKDKALEKLKKRYAGGSGDMMTISVKDGEITHQVELVKENNGWKAIKIRTNSGE